MIKRKTLSGIAVAVLSVLILGGCQKPKEKVTLSMWGPAGDQVILGGMVEEFKEYYRNEADFEIIISEESEVTCKETVLINPQKAADVYIFADDQFGSLCKNNTLHEVTENVDEIIAANGGIDSAAIQSASYNGKLYAYPMTASNGYFLYYNKQYFSEEDVKSFDKMMEIAGKNGKKVAMDFSSGWYLYSFFKGAGLNVEINEDGVTNSCDWNNTQGEYKGIDVAQAMCDIISNPGFLNCGDEDFVKGANEGTIIAGINGAWNAKNMENAYGDNYAATKLPVYTVAGNQVQMHSFAGYKLVGVNAYTENEKWAQRLARWITNEKNQIKRFEEKGDCPSDIKAAASDKVGNSPAVAALAMQAEYAHMQRVSDSFWMPAYVYGTTITAGNLDDIDLQILLDQMVKDITEPPKEN